jgi:hypothetical protein
MDSIKNKIIELRKEGKTYTQIQNELKCSKGTVSYHLGKGVKEKQNKRQWRNRTEAIHTLKKLYGGQCKICKYSRCLKALEFHHLDITNKIFEISMKRASVKQIAEEAKKCILICANCHRELHDGLICQKELNVDIILKD